MKVCRHGHPAAPRTTSTGATPLRARRLTYSFRGGAPSGTKRRLGVNT